MAPKKPLRVWARLANDVREHLSFKGPPDPNDPDFRSKSLQLTHSDVRQLCENITNSPLKWNHEAGTDCGRVVAHRIRHPGGQLEVELEVDRTSVWGEVVADKLERGEIAGVSLAHTWGSNRVEEVSICPQGAREGSGIIRASKQGPYSYHARPGTVPPKTSFFVLSFEPLHVKASDAMSTPAPAQAPPATDVMEVDPPAEPQEEKKEEATGESDEAVDMATDFPDAHKVGEMLNGKGPNTIPSRAQKEEIQMHVLKMENAKKEAERRAQELEAEAEKLREENKRHAETIAVRDKMFEDVAHAGGMPNQAVSISAALQQDDKLVAEVMKLLPVSQAPSGVSSAVLKMAAHLKREHRLKSEKEVQAEERAKRSVQEPTPTVSASRSGTGTGTAMSTNTEQIIRASRDPHSKPADRGLGVIEASTDYSTPGLVLPGDPGFAPLSHPYKSLIVAAAKATYLRCRHSDAKVRPMSRLDAERALQDSRFSDGMEPGAGVNFHYDRVPGASKEGYLILASAAAPIKYSEVRYQDHSRTPWSDEFKARRQTILASAAYRENRDQLKYHQGNWQPGQAIVPREYQPVTHSATPMTDYAQYAGR